MAARAADLGGSVPAALTAKSLLKRWLPRTVADRLRFAPWRLKKHRYSFEGEDTLADFLLRARIGTRVGCYVDVGANHPIHNSNTYWFYRRGWRGVCIDPTPGFAAAHARSRPRDVFVESGVGVEDELEFHTFEESRYNTFSQDLATRHRDRGEQYAFSTRVPVRPLMTILERCKVAPESVDLFSVDVEGHELAVLSGIDWQRFRPAVVIAEVFATSLPDLLVDPVNLLLEQAGYVAASKLHNSAIYVRRAVPGEG